MTPQELWTLAWSKIEEADAYEDSIHALVGLKKALQFEAQELLRQRAEILGGGA